MSYEQYRPTNMRLLPPVVKNILIINVILFIATITLAKGQRWDLNDMFGLHYFASAKFQPYQVITYMFMHGNLSHIFFNMFALWMFGSALENFWGPKRFLTYYLITGIGAAISHYAIMYFFEISPVLNQINLFLSNPSPESFNQFMHSKYLFSDIIQEVQNKYYNGATLNDLITKDPGNSMQILVDFMVRYKIEFLNAPNVVGASGAVFGLLLAFGMLFPNTLIYLYFAIPVKAKWIVIGYGALELYYGIYDSGTNVAHFAHLGGMLFGILLILYWKKRTKYFQ